MPNVFWIDKWNALTNRAFLILLMNYRKKLGTDLILYKIKFWFLKWIPISSCIKKKVRQVCYNVANLQKNLTHDFIKHFVGKHTKISFRSMHEQTTNSMISSEMWSADMLFIYIIGRQRNLEKLSTNEQKIVEITFLNQTFETFYHHSLLDRTPLKENFANFVLQTNRTTTRNSSMVTQGKRQCGRQCVQNYYVARKRDRLSTDSKVPAYCPVS